MKQLIKSIVPQIAVNAYKSYLKNIKYRGDAVTCPVCHATFKTFAPYGVIKRDNAKCLNCGSLERQRLIALYLKEKLHLFDNVSAKKIRLLHVAPEPFFYDIFSNNEAIDYYPCDLFPEKYTYNGTTQILKVDVTNIPFEDGFFDFIMCSHVLEHVPDDRLAMTELYRVLSKNGDSILQVPLEEDRKTTYEDPSITSPEERLRVFGQHDHVRIYGMDYKDRLKEAGFTVHEDLYINALPKEAIYTYGLMEGEVIYHCTK